MFLPKCVQQKKNQQNSLDCETCQFWWHKHHRHVNPMNRPFLSCIPASVMHSCFAWTKDMSRDIPPCARSLLSSNNAYLCEGVQGKQSPYTDVVLCIRFICLQQKCSQGKHTVFWKYVCIFIAHIVKNRNTTDKMTRFQVEHIHMLTDYDW